jgi:hypothetical protein
MATEVVFETLKRILKPKPRMMPKKGRKALTLPAARRREKDKRENGGRQVSKDYGRKPV